jgi:hypothetical protein
MGVPPPRPGPSTAGHVPETNLYTGTQLDVQLAHALYRRHRSGGRRGPERAMARAPP